jgi:DUF1680 family protein
MTAMFRFRDREPRWQLMPWSGEFIGKHLVCLVSSWRMSKEEIEEILRILGTVQDYEGYLGPFPRSQRLIGTTTKLPTEIISEKPTWDVWGHYHIIVGLLHWFAESNDHRALNIACKAADYIVSFFSSGLHSLSDAGAEETNMAIIHAILILFHLTGKASYRAFAMIVEKEWEKPHAGDYVRQALSGHEFFRMPKPRWESLHDIQGIAELYRMTGDRKYLDAFTHIWWSILSGDRHNTGGFSTGEQAIGNPYADGPIETCCTIAWMALSVDMLLLTGLSIVADELELSTWNGMIGAQHPSGRWWTYDTPMDGVRRSSAHDLVFQVSQGMPELNCCSVNGPRGLGIIGDWAMLSCDHGVVINFYGPLKMQAELAGGQLFEVIQMTDYPRSGIIEIRFGLSTTAEFTIHLRIPSWSKVTMITIGKTIKHASPGTYFAIKRKWKDGDSIELKLDMGPHYWVGAKEKASKLSVYHGPLLLAYDQRFNQYDLDAIPRIRPVQEPLFERTTEDEPHPLVLFDHPTIDGKTLTLCDFASAGACGEQYCTWLSSDNSLSSTDDVDPQKVWCRYVK